MGFSNKKKIKLMVSWKIKVVNSSRKFSKIFRMGGLFGFLCLKTGDKKNKMVDLASRGDLHITTDIM